jgi:hypothetical protein
MLTDKYNYVLNGIEHEITLNNNLKIDQKPINEKILVSNKYILKYVNDLFDYHSIDYCLVGNALLGVHIFNGINIFNQNIEIGISENNFFKLKKIESEIKEDDFDIKFNEKIIKITTIFFEKIKSTVIIYAFESENDLIRYKTHDNKIIYHEFYDIYPTRKNKFEEFEISIPNKIDKVLESYDFNMDYITFTKKKNDNKKIIEEVENYSLYNSLIKDNISKVISVIKPFIFSSHGN